MSFKMNELKARMKNRVESNYLCWKITQIDREKTSNLIRRNKQLGQVKDDLKSIRVSTGTTRQPSAESQTDRRNSATSSASDDESCSRQADDKDCLDVSITYANKISSYTSDDILELKKKDPVLIKRLKQMETFKRSGRAPYFEDHADSEKLVFSKASLNRQRRELCAESKSTMMMIPKENNYNYMYQIRLKNQIDLFIQGNSLVK